jgi:ribosomal protein L11 methyltransferase
MDWNEDWKKGFTAIDVGENLTIVPSWLRPHTKRIPIIIDPGMVFGTGHHETTRTCLGIIERIAKKHKNNRLLDIGTGTGILAIGAALLGFDQVLAVDVDPLAVEAAARNAGANNLNNIEIREGTISVADGSFDVIVATLLSEILMGIASELSERLNPGGTAVLSGMLAGQEDDVMQAMTAAALTFQEKIMDGTWATLVVRK